MAQAHARDRARDARRLERVVPGRLAGLDVAEAAAARAGVAEDHERGGAALPALADVRAGGLLADGVQVLRADQLGQLAVALAAGRGHLEPRRLALAQRPHVGAEHAEHVHAAGVGAGAGRSGGAHAGTASTDAGGSTGAGWFGWMGARVAARLAAFAVSMPRRRGETRRWRRSCASTEAVGHALAEAGRAPAPDRRSSRAIEVMLTSGSPQATTHENGSRSLSTLTAKPWVVTPRETCTPIEAILRSPPVHPHAGVVGPVLGPRARLDARPRRARRRSRPPSCAGSRPTSSMRHDRIADELAGAVIGDPPAAVGGDHVDALGAVEVLAERQVRRRRSAARACTRAGARAAAACRAARRPGAGRGHAPGWPARRDTARRPGGTPTALATIDRRRSSAGFSLAPHERQPELGCAGCLRGARTQRRRLDRPGSRQVPRRTPRQKNRRQRTGSRVSEQPRRRSRSP